MGGRGGGGGARSGGGYGNGGGGGGGRGGGASSNGDIAQVLQALQLQNKQQQQLLNALQRGGGADGAGKGGGQSKGGGKGAGARLAPPRDGDWGCPRCSFYPNFAGRARCFECGAARPPSSSASRGGSLTTGPVGAGGLRPQLAWGGARLGTAERAPTHRVPGTSAAAPPRTFGASAGTATAMPTKPAAQAAGGGGATAAPRGQAVASGGGARATTAVADADGFVEVVGRNARRAKARMEGEDAAPTRHAAAEAATAPAATGGGTHATATCTDADDDGWQMDWEEEEAQEGADQQGGEEQDSAALKLRLDKENSAVKALAREGLGDAHPAMVAAVAARDAADAAWRSARTPHPVARRMGWAQRRLDKAMRARDKIRDELDDFDTATREKRAAIVDRLGLAVDRVSRQREALEALQEEAAVDVPNNRRNSAAADVCAQLAGGMRMELAPTVEALAAEIPEGSAAHAHLSIVIAKLEGMQGRLEQAASAADGHQRCNFSDADAPSEAEWSESHELEGAHGDGTEAAKGGHQWMAKGHGRWRKEADGSTQHQGKGENINSAVRPSNAAQPAEDGSHVPGGTATSPPAPTQEGTAVAANPCDAGPTGGGTEQGEDDSGECQPPANKSRKGQDPADSAEAHVAAQDAARARQLMESQRATAAAGAYGSQAAIQAAGQVHARNVAQVVAAAIDQGVQPITEAGEELIMLGPQELEEWTSKHLAKGRDKFW